MNRDSNEVRPEMVEEILKDTEIVCSKIVNVINEFQKEQYSKDRTSEELFSCFTQIPANLIMYIVNGFSDKEIREERINLILNSCFALYKQMEANKMFDRNRESVILN